MADTTKSAVMMALGDFRFSLSTAAFQELVRNTAYKWAAIERIGVRPAMQFTGMGEETIKMSGSVFPAYKGGLSQIAKMRETAAKGLPQTLIDGTGRNWGSWCITDVNETQTVFFSNGTPRRIDFDISLTIFGGD